MKRTFTALIILFLFTGLAGAQPVLIKEIPSGSRNFTKVGNLVFFVSGDSLLRTDGTTAGTVVVTTGLNGPNNLVGHNGLLYFSNDTIVDPRFPWIYGSKELWRSDGTPSGTFRLQTSAYPDIEVLKGAGNYLYFLASSGSTGKELYRTDGTVAGTILLKDIMPGSGNGFIGGAMAAGNILFFGGNDSVHGTELWKTDGTVAGTVMVKDINPGADSGYVINNYWFRNLVYNGILYFTGDDGIHGPEPWKSDGTEVETVMIKEINTQDLDDIRPQFEIANNGFVYFVVQDSGYYESGPGDLWKTDGTAANTSFILTIGDYPDINYDFGKFLIYKDDVYFFVREDYFSDHLWKTNGTTGGTQEIFSMITIDGGVEYFEVVGDYMLFYWSAEGYPSGFYRSDGTPAGTVGFTSFNSAGYGTFPRTVTKIDTLVFYGDHDGPGYEGVPDDPDTYYQLIQTNGFETVSIRSIFGGSYIGTNNIVDFNGKVMFTTLNNQYDSHDHTMRLWIYDPASASQVNSYFTLVNAATDADIRTMKDNDTIYYNPSVDRITIRANPTQTVGSILFRLNGAVYIKESKAPYALKGDSNGDYHPWNASYGSYTLTTSAYSGPGGSGTLLEERTIHFRVMQHPVASGITFTLVNAETDTDIGPLTNGQTIDLSAAGTSKLSVRANSSLPGTESIVFDFNGTANFKIENAAPYALFGDSNGDYLSYYSFAPGTYSLKATSYTQDNAQGVAGPESAITFYVVQGSGGASALRTYPNPVSSNFTIALDDEAAAAAEVIIYDAQGNEYYRGIHQFASGQANVTLDNVIMPKGMYFVKLNSGGVVKTVKILKD